MPQRALGICRTARWPTDHWYTPDLIRSSWPSRHSAALAALTWARLTLLGAADDEPVQMLAGPPNAVCTMACSPATVVPAVTSSRRQISGLIPAITTRSR